MSKVCSRPGCERGTRTDLCMLHRPRKAIITRKRPRQKGRRAIQYEIWRDFTAIPYLTKTFGYLCTCCGRGDVHLDVAHTKTRGSRADLKMSLDNVSYRCRPCHRNETDHLPCPH